MRRKNVEKDIFEVANEIFLKFGGLYSSSNANKENLNENLGYFSSDKNFFIYKENAINLDPKNNENIFIWWKNRGLYTLVAYKLETKEQLKKEDLWKDDFFNLYKKLNSTSKNRNISTL